MNDCVHKLAHKKALVQLQFNASRRIVSFSVC